MTRVAFEGAYVKTPIPGMYNSVVSFDVASLYPSIIRSINIGVETKIKKISNISVEDALRETDEWEALITQSIDNNYTLSLNGVNYTRDKKSFFSVLIEDLFNKRMLYKKTAKDASSKLELINAEMKRRNLEIQ